MKKKLVAALAALACANACFGLDITTRSGTAYRHCEVVKVEPDGIRISHDAGAAKISFEELPDKLQQQYGYDAAKVAAYRKAVADAKAVAEAKATAARVQADDARKQQAVAEQQRALEHAEAEAQERESSRGAREAKLETQRPHDSARRFVSAIIVVGFLLYFFPTLIALLRGKSNWFAIGVLNFFLGWTLIGWVIALVWALTKDAKLAVQTVIVQYPTQPYPETPPVMKGVAGRVIEPRRLPPNA